MCKGPDKTNGPLPQRKSGKFQFSLHAMMVAVAVVSVSIFLAREFGGLFYDLYIRDLTAQEFQRIVGVSQWLALVPELRARLLVAAVGLESILIWGLYVTFSVDRRLRRRGPLTFVAFFIFVILLSTVILIFPGRILDTSEVRLGSEVTAYLATAVVAIVMFSFFVRLSRFCRWLGQKLFGPAAHLDTPRLPNTILKRNEFRARTCVLLVPFVLSLLVWWTTLPSRTWETFITYVATKDFVAAENMLAKNQRIQILYRGKSRTPFWTISRADGTYVIGCNAKSKTHQLKRGDLVSRTISDVFLARNRAYEFSIQYQNRKYGYFEVRGSEIHFVPDPEWQ